VRLVRRMQQKRRDEVGYLRVLAGQTRGVDHCKRVGPGGGPIGPGGGKETMPSLNLEVNATEGVGACDDREEREGRKEGGKAAREGRGRQEEGMGCEHREGEGRQEERVSKAKE